MGLVEILLTTLTASNITTNYYTNIGNENSTEELDDVNADISATEYERLVNQIQNETLKFTTLKNDVLSGYVKDDSNGEIIGTGIAFDLIHILQDKYKFHYQIELPQSSKVLWLGPEDDGVLNLLHTKKANVAVAFLPVLYKYTKSLSYSPSFDTGQWLVLMVRPKESASGSGLLAPFTLPVWLLTLISCLAVGPLIYAIISLYGHLIEPKESLQIFSIRNCLWFVYGALLKQGSTLNPITNPSRIVFATWWIFITILTAFYTANLTAFLTLSKFTLPISDPHQMSRIKWITTQGNSIEEALNDNTTNLRQTLGTPIQYVDESNEIVLEKYVRDRGIMYIREEPILDYIMFDEYKRKVEQGIEEKDRCTFVKTKFSVATFKRAFAYSKQFQYKQIFDTALQRLIESGIIQYKMREFLPQTEICPLDLGQKERQLKNSDLLLTYVLVGIGLGLATVIFLGEIYKRKSITTKHGKNLLAIEEDVKKKIQYLDENPVVNVQFVFNIGPEQKRTTDLNGEEEIAIVTKTMLNGRHYFLIEYKNGRKTLIPRKHTPSALLYNIKYTKY